MTEQSQGKKWQSYNRKIKEKSKYLSNYYNGLSKLNRMINIEILLQKLDYKDSVIGEKGRKQSVTCQENKQNGGPE